MRLPQYEQSERLMLPPCIRLGQYASAMYASLPHTHTLTVGGGCHDIYAYCDACIPRVTTQPGTVAPLQLLRIQQ